MQDILKQIATMDLNQVNQVKEAVLNRLDSLKGDVRSSLIVGQTIRVNHPKAQGKQFKIIKLKCKFRLWNVTHSIRSSTIHKT
jgi:hypothetical protein